MSTKTKVALAGLVVLALGVGAWTLSSGNDDNRLDETRVETEVASAAGIRRDEARANEKIEESAGGVAAKATEGLAKETSEPEAAGPAMAPGMGRLELTVVHHDGRPAARVPVRALPFGATDPFFRERHFLTDETGQLVIESWNSGRSLITTPLGGYKRVAITAGEVTVETFEIPEGPRVHGVVVHADGRPANGAEIVSADFGHPIHGDPIARTDAEGRFDIPSFGVNSMGIMGARLEGYQPSVLVMVMGGKDAEKELRLVLGDRAPHLTLVFVNADGEPAGETRLVLSTDHRQFSLPDGNRAMGFTGVDRLTDASGRIELTTLPAETFTFRARAIGYAVHEEELTLAAGERRTHRVVLKRGGRVSGTLGDGLGGPQPKVSVTLGQYGSIAGHFIHTDAEGRFRFDDVAPGTHKLVLERDGVGRIETEITVRAGEETVWTGDLEKNPSIVGIVVDEAGNPLADISVSARANILIDGQFRSAGGYDKSDAEGLFEIAGLEKDLAFEIKVNGPSGLIPIASLEGVVPGGDPVRLVVDRARLGIGELVGRVVGPDGAPISNGDVSLHHESGNSTGLKTLSSEGHFHFDELMPGVYHLAVSSAGHGYQKFGPFTVTRDAVQDITDVRLEGGGRVELVLDDPEGLLPLGKVEAYARHLEGGVTIGVLLTSERTISNPLAPGPYRITIRHEGIADLAGDIVIESAGTTRLNLEIRPGRTIAVSLDNDPEGATPLRYRLLDAQGALLRDGRWWGWPEKPQPLKFNVGASPRTLELEDEAGRKARAVLGPMTADAVVLTLR